MKAKRLIATAALTSASLAAVAQPQYVVTDLGPAGASSQGFAISNNGNYAMGLTIGTGTNPGFTSSAGTRTDWTMNSAKPFISPAGGGVNNIGTAVSAAGTTLFGSSPVPVMYKNGTLTNLNMPAGYTVGTALDINNSSTATGSVGTGTAQRAVIYSTFSNGSSVLSSTTADGAYMANGRAINDNGWITGTGFDSLGGQVGLVYHGNTMTQIGSGVTFTPTDINEDGMVVGSNAGMAFTWTLAGGLVSTGITGSATALNNSGWIVGKTGAGGNSAYVYDGTTAHLLDSIVTNNAGWSFTGSSVAMNGIANNGSIVGTAMFNGVAHAVILTAVPEPSTYVLMLAGIIGVGVIARRRSAKA